MFNFSNLEEVFNEYFSQKDIYVTLKVTKEQAKIGVSIPIEINRKIISENNNSTVTKIVEIIDIPKNTKNSTILKLEGKGNQDNTSKENGNLYVEIKIFGTK